MILQESIEVKDYTLHGQQTKNLSIRVDMGIFEILLYNTGPTLQFYSLDKRCSYVLIDYIKSIGHYIVWHTMLNFGDYDNSTIAVINFKKALKDYYKFDVDNDLIDDILALFFQCCNGDI